MAATIDEPTGAVAAVGDVARSASLGERYPFLRDRRRLLAILLTSLAGTMIVVFVVARGELAGADARAYWGGVRVWLAGGDPMVPPQPYLPYVYAPWTVPLFLPWALLPWDVAWIVWRGVNVLLLVWSASWAYQRHPLATAILLCILAAPIAATLDTGNLTLLCALGVWAAQFTGPRLGGGLWALATVLKWFPAPLWLILPPRARLWGLIWIAIAGESLGLIVAFHLLRRLIRLPLHGLGVPFLLWGLCLGAICVYTVFYPPGPEVFGNFHSAQLILIVPLLVAFLGMSDLRNYLLDHLPHSHIFCAYTRDAYAHAVLIYRLSGQSLTHVSYMDPDGGYHRWHTTEWFAAHGPMVLMRK